MKEIISIFTPTYNRCEKLKRLYDSLCKQRNKSFIWIIIDDGSNDCTKESVSQWIDEKCINIVYRYQENQGKHVAFNEGVRLCETVLFFCVDSDDYLTDSAIDIISDTWHSIIGQDNIAGIVAYRGYSPTDRIGSEFPRDMVADSLKNIYKYGKTGDTALIYRTEVLKKYPFPVFPNERFLRESVVYSIIDQSYFMYILPVIIYIGEYLEDGLSKNARKLDDSSPNGAALYRLSKFHDANSLWGRVAYGMAYSYYMVKADRKQEIKENLGKVYGFICLNLVWAEKIRRRIK